jgi:hypothetical protein
MAERSRDRVVHVVWCDDIRYEVGNKPSFMGVYTAALVMPGFPAVLTRLAAYVSSWTPVERPFRKLAINVRTGAQTETDSPIARIELPIPGTDAALAAAAPLGHDPSKMFMFADAAVLLPPIVLTEETKWLKVFVETEEETLESFKLQILRADPPQAVSEPAAG